MYTLTEFLVFAIVNIAIYASYPRIVKRFATITGRLPNIAFPQAYHDKMFWRKVFDRNPLFFTFCDKLATKKYYRENFPDLAVLEPLWTGQSINPESLTALGNNAVLKANHASGFNLFPEEYGKGHAHVAKKLQRWLRIDYGWRKLEPAYHAARRVFFAERLLPDVLDLYFRCVMGRIVLVSVMQNAKKMGVRVAFYDANGQRLPSLEPEDETKRLPPDFALPDCFNEALDYARQVSSKLDFIRVDFIVSGQKLYAGEITVYPDGGFTVVRKDPSRDFSILVNNYWDIRNSHFFRARHGRLMEFYKRCLLDFLNRRRPEPSGG